MGTPIKIYIDGNDSGQEPIMEKSASYNHRKLMHSLGEREQKQKKRERKEKP